MTYIINYSRMLFTKIVDNQSTIINNRMLSAGICNLMAIQIDSYIFILCNYKWRCQCNVLFQRNHVINSRRHSRLPFCCKRSDWEQSNDHRYSEDNAEDSFAFSF